MIEMAIDKKKKCWICGKPATRQFVPSKKKRINYYCDKCAGKYIIKLPKSVKKSQETKNQVKKKPLLKKEVQKDLKSFFKKKIVKDQ